MGFERPEIEVFNDAIVQLQRGSTIAIKQTRMVQYCFYLFALD